MKASKTLKSLFSIIAFVIGTNTIYAQQLAFANNPQTQYKLTGNSGITPTNNTGLIVEIKPQAEKDKIRLLVYNREERNLTITLASENQEFWSMKTRENFISRILNLSSLEDGPYVIEISNGKTKITKKILLQSKIKTEKNIQIN